MAVAARRPHFQATHFLGLPLYNSKSKSQLEKFAHKLRNDEYAEDIPHRAFNLPAAFHIPVADFILKSGRDIKAALNLLRRLDMERILKESTTSTATARINKQPDSARKEHVARAGFDDSVIPPLQVSLTGLEGAKTQVGRGENVRVLYGTINEPSGRLRGFVRGIRQNFASARFQMYSDLVTEEDYVKSKHLVYRVINGGNSRKFEIFVDATGNILKKRRMVQYDATALCQRYENVEIARNIIFEKLSLYKEGCKRTYRGDHHEFLVDEYYEEIGSTPMPHEA